VLESLLEAVLGAEVEVEVEVEVEEKDFKRERMGDALGSEVDASQMWCRLSCLRRSHSTCESVVGGYISRAR